MNKQFLSLLLLTTFVGTMSAAVPAASLPFRTVMKYAMQRYSSTARISLGKFRSSVTGLMSTTGTKIAQVGSATIAKVSGLGHTGQTAVIATGLGSTGVAAFTVATSDTFKNAVKSTGNYMGQVQEFGSLSMATPISDALKAAALNARPWYTKVADYSVATASAVKASTVAASTTAFEFAKANRGKTAGIVIGAGVLGYLAYRGYNKMFSSDSISLNEQQRVSLQTALVKATDLISKPGNVFAGITEPAQLTVGQYFTTTETGLPKKVVEALNEHVEYGRLANKTLYLLDHQNGRTNPQTVAIHNSAKALDAQVMGMFSPVVAA